MSSIRACPFVFVYGTLKKGFRANYKLDPGEFVGEAITPPSYKMYGSGFPMAIEADPGHSIKGEVYEINQRILDGLDTYEGFPTFYNRKIIPVGGVEGVDQAWIYFVRERQIGTDHLVKPNNEGLLVWERR